MTTVWTDWLRDKYEVKAGGDNSVDCVADWSIDNHEVKDSSGSSVDCVAGWLSDKYEVKREEVVTTVWDVLLSGQCTNETSGSSVDSVGCVASCLIG